MNSDYAPLHGLARPQCRHTSTVGIAPLWYRVLRFICIWACWSFVTANVALLLVHSVHAQVPTRVGSSGSAAIAAPEPGTAHACADDGVQSVRAGRECLVVHAQGKPAADGRTLLLVFVHGDQSSGGPSGPLPRRIARYAGPGTVVVTLIRPGYYDRDGRESTGSSYRFTGDGYPPKVVDAVGAAIARLRKLYYSRRVLVVGFSGGSAITAVLLGRMPGLIDSAVLVGCPCNIQAWRQWRGSGNWKTSLSPHRFIKRIPKTTYVINVAGEYDINTPPFLSQNYVDLLRKSGVSATFLLAEQATHSTMRSSRAFMLAVQMAFHRMHVELDETPKTPS